MLHLVGTLGALIAALQWWRVASARTWNTNPWTWVPLACALAWLAAVRLLGLLLTPRGKPLFKPGTIGAGWRWEAAWWVDLALAGALLLLTIGFRFEAVTTHWPPPAAWGTDAHANLFNAWVLGTGSLHLYFGANYPGYPWLVAQVSRLAGLDLSTAGLWVSAMAMSLGALGLYAAVRLTLGRWAALGAGLLFAVGPPFHSYAAARNSYALLTCLVLLYVASTAAALRLRHTWPWLLSGVTLAAMTLVDVKGLVIGLVAIPFLGGKLLLRDTSWRLRLTGPVLLGLPLLGAQWLLAHLDLTPIATKFENQAIDVFRILHTDLPAPATGTGQIWSMLPPLDDVMAYNLGQLHAQLPEACSPLVLACALLGVATPFVLRRSAPGRLTRGLVGVALHLGILATCAGAVTVLFATRYLIHALPFLLALAVQGTWAAAVLAAPRRAPAVLVPAAGLGCLLLLVLAFTVVAEPPAPRWRADFLWRGPMDAQSDAAQGLEGGAVMAAALAPLLDPDTELVLCEAGVVGVFLPRALKAPPQARYLEPSPCRIPPEPPGPGGRVIVLDPGRVQAPPPGSPSGLEGAELILEQTMPADRGNGRIIALRQRAPGPGRAP